MAIGRFILLSGIKDQTPLNSYGFLICLVSSLAASATAYVNEMSSLAFFYVLLANVYGAYWVLSGFGFRPLPALLKPGASTSAIWVTAPLGVLCALSLVTSYLGNDLGAHYGSWLALGVAALAFCGLYRKGLSHRAYGLILSAALFSMASGSAPGVGAMLVAVQLPWFLPAIRRPMMEPPAPFTQAETPDQNPVTELSKKPKKHEKEPIVSCLSSKIREISDQSRNPKKRVERIEPSIETLADIPDTD